MECSVVVPADHSVTERSTYSIMVITLPQRHDSCQDFILGGGGGGGGVDTYICYTCTVALEVEELLIRSWR